MTNLQALAKAGAIGLCSIITCCFGFFFLIPGIALTASANDDDFDSEFFEPSNNGMRIAGGVLLSLGILCSVVGSILCCIACKTIRNKQPQSGIVISQARPFQGPTISGQGPQGPIYTQQPYPQYHYGQPGMPPPTQQPQNMPYPTSGPTAAPMPPMPNSSAPTDPMINPYQQPPYNPEFSSQQMGQPPSYSEVVNK